jgi:hypothetical protein
MFDTGASTGKRMMGFAHKKLSRKVYHKDYLFNLTGEGYDFSLQNFCFLGSVALNC